MSPDARTPARRPARIRKRARVCQVRAESPRSSRRIRARSANARAFAVKPVLEPRIDGPSAAVSAA
jgi:hypothetical protein